MEAGRWKQLRVIIDRRNYGDRALVTVVYRTVQGRVIHDKRLFGLEVELRREMSSRAAISQALREAWIALEGADWPETMP
jgi:hypothetical protein